jgi:hypothetical protein
VLGSIAALGTVHASGADDVPSVLARADAGSRGRILRRLQQGLGNATVSRMVAAVPPPRRTSVALLQRDDALQQELVVLNGASMESMLGQVDGMDAGKRADLRRELESMGGRVNVPRLRLAFAAVDGKQSGTGAEAFGLGNRGALTDLGHQDQRDAILRFVGGGKWKPPKPLELGDKVMGGRGIVHAKEVKVRKGDALTWQANNPGAIGAEPKQGGFKPPGAYAGKTIGRAAIAIFPDEATGFAAAVAWVKYKAAQGVTFKGFFKAHAPPPKPGTPGNIGNDPNAYFNNVAKGMGKNPDAVGHRPLSAMDPTEVAKGLQKMEGWGQGGESLAWDSDKLPEKDRFALLYSEWAGTLKR